MIEQIFMELKDGGDVRSSNEFSRDWLGMEESYLRCLRARKREPSAKVLATCAVRLRTTGDVLATSVIPSVSEKGVHMLQLGESCIDEILAQAMEAST